LIHETSMRLTATSRVRLSAVLVACATSLTVAASSPASTPAVAASTKLETDNYLVEITAAGPFKVGAEGLAKVTLTTKGAYHVNPQYPYRFKAGAPPSGLSYPKPVLQRADGQFEERRAVFSLPFVTDKAGHFNVGGTFHMSVCSAASCLVDKPALDVVVTVE
jgi:hypothetical protein